jgi:hypothetical protein
MVDLADLLHLVGAHGVLLVTEQDAELLVRFERHRRAATVGLRRSTRKDLPLRDLAPCQTLNGGGDELKIDGQGFTDTGNFVQQMLRRSSDFSERPESAHHSFAIGLTSLPQDRVDYTRLEHVVIRQPICPCRCETVAQPVPIAKMMWLAPSGPPVIGDPSRLADRIVEPGG